MKINTIIGSYLLEDSLFVQPCFADARLDEAEEGRRSGSQARPDILGANIIILTLLHTFKGKLYLVPHCCF